MTALTQVRCPDYSDPTCKEGEESIIGCGSANVEWIEDEGVYECLNCGMWFDDYGDRGTD